MSSPKLHHYHTIKHRHITEKSMVLEGLAENRSNPSVRCCKNPQYVFVVDKKANKTQIAKAVEAIYSTNGIKVVSVNTINVKPKSRRFRGHKGKTSGFKKAIVTLEEGDKIE